MLYSGLLGFTRWLRRARRGVPSQRRRTKRGRKRVLLFRVRVNSGLSFSLVLHSMRQRGALGVPGGECAPLGALGTPGGDEREWGGPLPPPSFSYSLPIIPSSAGSNHGVRRDQLPPGWRCAAVRAGGGNNIALQSLCGLLGASLGLDGGILAASERS